MGQEYKKRDGVDIAPPAYISTEKKTKAERLLIGAMLREPFNLSKHLGRLSAVALSHSGGDLPAAFAEILNQFLQYGNYSALSIAQKTGVDVSYYASNDTEIDLEWAVDLWWSEYSVWAENMAMMHGLSASVSDSGVDAMRAAVDEARERYGVNTSDASTSPAGAFVEWGMDKLDGKEKFHIARPHANALRDVVKAFCPGDFWIVGGRPSMGKTQFSMNLLSGFYDAGAKGLYFSLEMLGEALLRRLLGVRHGINPLENWDNLDRHTVSRALSETASISEGNTKIIDTAYTVHDIESACTAAHYRGELDFVVIDYIGIMQGRASAQNRERELAGISASLKRMAKRLNVPVIALSQLSRAVETRGGSKRPLLSDLRDTGTLEQDADGVMFLYRPEYYGIMEDENGESLKGVGEVIVAKQRNGPVDTVRLSYTPIRGYRDFPENRFQADVADFTVPKSETNEIITAARPSADQDIPF